MAAQFQLRRRIHSEPNDSIKQQNDDPPKRSLRSNTVIEEPKIKPKIDPETLPYIEYKGKIVYCTNAVDISVACDYLLDQAEKAVDYMPLAFDVEWPFSFKTGPGKAALIQVCFDVNVCYLFQISEMFKLPSPLLLLLKHPKVRCHGVNIKNDFRKLERDFKINVDPMINNCIDLGTWYNHILNTTGRWSLERLVAEICKLRINKDKSVRMSQWNVVPLSKNQQLYAAIDVYIGQVIYYEIHKLQQQVQDACNAIGFEDDLCFQ